MQFLQICITHSSWCPLTADKNLQITQHYFSLHPIKHSSYRKSFKQNL